LDCGGRDAGGHQVITFLTYVSGGSSLMRDLGLGAVVLHPE
jgi:hypothetical protein